MAVQVTFSRAEIVIPRKAVVRHRFGEVEPVAAENSFKASGAFIG